MKAKKKLGIIGGMGARASALFLQKIIEYSPALTDQEFIEIVLHSNSCIPDRTRAIVYEEDSPVQELLRSVRLLNDSNMDVIALACITSYYYYKEVMPISQATIIHPVPLVCDYIKTHLSQVRRVGLLATTGTIQSKLFCEEFENNGLELLTLSEADQENYFMRSVYMKNGLKSSSISDDAYRLMLSAASKLESSGAEVIIGGCSEVAIALNQGMLSVPFIDAIDLLAKESVNQCYDLKKETISSVHEY